MVGTKNVMVGTFFIFPAALFCETAGLIPIMLHTPQPLYNTIVGVQANFPVSYPIRVITRIKCIVK